MNDYTLALIGGGILGLASTVFWLLEGKVFGVSGFLGGVVKPRSLGGDRLLKAAVLLGLVCNRLDSGIGDTGFRYHHVARFSRENIEYRCI